MPYRLFWLVLCACLLSGCEFVVLNPSGDVAAQQGDLIIYATVLMLIVILPVMALTIFFAFKYRDSNEGTTYEPDWDHSVSLEIVIWSLPLAIIICLAGLTWVATHRLEPYDDLKRISETKAIDSDDKPLTVQVVSLDWKWLFIYPEYGIATVNEAAAIVDRPIEWKLTSSGVMNAFYIPHMAGMIYTMAGMETELNAVMNEPGTFKGFSANYSGLGFSHMDFEFHASEKAGFEAWVTKVKEKGSLLDRTKYTQLEKKSTNHEIEYFSLVEKELWDRIVNMCVAYDKLCQDDMIMVDALGGGGLEGLKDPFMFADICTVDDPQAHYARLRTEQEAGSVQKAYSSIPANVGELYSSLQVQVNF